MFINSYQRTLKKKTSPVEKSELFVNNFSIALQNIWRIWNTIASTLCKNILVHLPTDTICFSKLTSSVSSIYFVPWIFPWMFFKELVDIDEKYQFLTINGKSKTKKWEIWFPIFNFPFHFPNPHSLFLLLVTSGIENKISSPLLWLVSTGDQMTMEKLQLRCATVCHMWVVLRRPLAEICSCSLLTSSTSCLNLFSTFAKLGLLALCSPTSLK